MLAIKPSRIFPFLHYTRTQMKVYILALLAALTGALQIPFTQNRLFNSQPHYSTLKQSDWPIDLSAYKDQMVVRMRGEMENALVSQFRSRLVSTDAAWSDVLMTLNQKKFKVWAHNPHGKTVDVQVNLAELEELMATFGISEPEFVIRDMAQTVFESYPSEEAEPFVVEDVSTKADFHAMSDIFFKLYRPLSSINAWLELIRQTYPELVQIEELGHTYEGRPYKVIHLADHSTDSHSDKKTIVITGGVHAREWISVSTVLYSLYEMLQEYEANPDMQQQWAQLDFLFIPVQNPDGYDYTWTTDRLWRKNRQPTSDSANSCVGIDIDHSYDYHWTKSEDTACGEDYSGEFPFEAYELKIWSDYLNSTNYSHDVWGYIDLHSYSQEILYPYAYTCQADPRDEENLIELAYGISKAIRMTSRKFYSVLPACVDKDADMIPDLGAGTALDYMYHHKAYWAFQMKLRDSGSHGFLLPDKYIQPVGEEIAAGLKYFVDFILSSDR